MSLSITSDAFIWSIRALLLVAVVAIVWGWPRLARRGILPILGRLVALTVVSGLGVINVLAPVNASYGWYLTVADLMPGAEDQRGTAVHQGSASSTAADPPVASAPIISGPRTRPAQTLNLTETRAGGYQDFTVTGPASGVTGTVTVWFPPSYTTPAAANREYPVIEGFHGIQPAPYAYFGVVEMDQAIMDAVAAHQMREALVVIPHWAPGGQDNECTDSAAGPKMETWLTKDVPQWVYDNLRAAPGRTSWAAFGYSAGGWCANMAAMLHPSVYATTISLGGYWRPTFDPPFVPFTPGSPEAKRYDLIALVHRTPPPVAAWTLTGRQDRLSVPGTERVTREAKAPFSITTTILPQGAHNADLWIPHIPDALAWLGKTSRGFAPGA